jgi:hypothetical protein
MACCAQQFAALSGIPGARPASCHHAALAKNRRHCTEVFPFRIRIYYGCVVLHPQVETRSSLLATLKMLLELNTNLQWMKQTGLEIRNRLTACILD